jgi:hypothetical protein
MKTLKDIYTRMGALLSDPDLDWLTPGYAVPLINQVYEQQIQYLSGTCSPFATCNVPVPNIGVGVTDLTPFQLPGKPLDHLWNPLRLLWKAAGAPESSYAPMREYEELPWVTIGAAGSAPMRDAAGYEWRGSTIYITPFSFPIDLGVRAEFLPPPLLKMEDVVQVHPNMGHSLIFGSAALAAVERGNPQWVQSYGGLATTSLDEIASQLIRQQGGVTYRAGRANSRHGSR